MQPLARELYIMNGNKLTFLRMALVMCIMQGVMKKRNGAQELIANALVKIDASENT